MRSSKQWRADEAALRAAVAKDEFLKEWLLAANGDRSRFEADTAELNAEAKESLALKIGFRTWQSLRVCQRDTHRTLEQFSRHQIYQSLWQQLRDLDAVIDWGPMLYGPHNGGVPQRLLRAIETWHQSPKFTAAELAQQKAKIAKTCGILIELIGQLSPGNFGDHFGAFRVTVDEAKSIFAVFKSPKNLQQRRGKAHAPFWASGLLKRGGVTPVWALHNIIAATQLGGGDVLPTKVRAPTAFRTYLIHELCNSVRTMASHNEFPISDQLAADVVSLLSNRDCSADDVRKTMRGRREADRASLPEHSSPKS